MTPPLASAAFPGALDRASLTADIEVLRFDLDADDIDPAWARAHVTEDEAARADRFAADMLKRRGLHTRALVRAVLGAWTGNDPLALDFETGPNDKPRLAQWEGFAFNISHSGPRLLIALSTRGDVGVDVELTGGAHDAAAIARRQFTAEENAALDGLSGDAHERAFLRLWTLKEACLKALGFRIADGMAKVRPRAEALAAIAARDWSPGVVEVDEAALTAFDVSWADEISCVAVDAASPST
ncbi:MAG: 4'-phosphopantetheinyl transferase superfamily protein [Maricaulaceae bacterium]|jgi:4'-phosphopantetheinyl transferase